MALLLAAALVSAGCETMTLDTKQLFVASRAWSKFIHPKTLEESESYQYSSGVVIGSRAEAIMYLPPSTAASDASQGLPVRPDRIDRVYLQLSLRARGMITGSVRFGVYRIRSDWTAGMGGRVTQPMSTGNATEWSPGFRLLLNMAMMHWPADYDEEPIDTFTLTSNPLPARKEGYIHYPAMPDPTVTSVTVNLTKVARSWFAGSSDETPEPGLSDTAASDQLTNYGVLIKPLPDEHVPTDLRWVSVQGSPPALIMVPRESAG